MIRLMLSAILAIAAWSAPALAQGGQTYASNDSGPTTLPPGFHGRIYYFGNHTGEITSRRTNRDGPRKDCIRPDGSCPEQVGGSLRVSLTFDGDVVSGTFHGTGGLRESKLLGRRIGSTCSLYDPIDGSTWIGTCDLKNFAGRVTSVENALVRVDLKFNAVSVAVNDYSEWKERIARMYARLQDYDNWRAQYEGAYNSEEALLAAVKLSSFRWERDPLVPESVSLAGPPTKFGGVYYQQVNYSLKSGTRAWARARLTKRKNGEISCLIFWDRPREEDCRAFVMPQRPPEPPSRRPQDENMPDGFGLREDGAREAGNAPN